MSHEHFQFSLLIMDRFAHKRLKHCVQLASRKLSAQVGMSVDPVSSAAFAQNPAETTGGVPATIVKRRMRELIAEGQS